ncbi:MAG: SPFH domain-containing protein [Planctomycetaceae bacterium]
MSNDYSDHSDDNSFPPPMGSRPTVPLQSFLRKKNAAVGVVGLLIGLVVFGFVSYTQFRIDVPAKSFAVLTRKTGEDITNLEEVAPDENHKGLQQAVLTEGRYFYNPYTWHWSVHPMVEIPRDKMGVRVRLYGEDLGYGHFVSTNEQQKGIVKEVLKPGRYAMNAIVIDGKTKDMVGQKRDREDYVEIIELWEPTVIPAGYQGVVTNLAGPMPENSNTLLVEKDKRGPQKETLEAGTYYLNPYMYRVNAVDCRSQRFNLSQLNQDMGFPSKDGFWISLDGIIEFHIQPEKAASVYVTYNEVGNDGPGASSISEEIINKVIRPNARSFCRLRGSNSSGRDFIGGETRSAFQKEFENAIRNTCEQQGIEIVQALITRIKPPEEIRGPVRDREIALQELAQYDQQKIQQQQEAELATEKALIEQRTRLVDAEREVVKLLAEAKKRQEVATAQANRDREVAEKKLEAARDQAEAVLAEKKAEAAVIAFANQAEAAGWKKSVEALGNDGDAFARYVLYQKLAPGYRSIMTNTADSPLMSVFQSFSDKAAKEAAPAVAKKPLVQQKIPTVLDMKPSTTTVAKPSEPIQPKSDAVKASEPASEGAEAVEPASGKAETTGTQKGGDEGN